ncbi:MAG: glycosyltransferase family 4 protein [Candidatus Promineofilum sp.]|nr:glycosyltransferase family 4 protein [Promineifilum sp.]
MIIGIDASRTLSGQRTGTEAYAYFLVRNLIPLCRERGHTLRLYFNQPPRDDLFPDWGESERVVIPQRRLWTHLRLGRELRRRPPDVFFTPAHVIPVGYRRPAVATIHDLGYEYFPEAHPRRQLAYLRWSTRHNARVGRRVIADSSATRDDLLHFYATNPAKIDVVYPGIDSDLHRVEDPGQIVAAGAKYGIQSPYLLYLGTLQPRKNLVRLVEALAASGLHQQGYYLVLAGKAGWLAQPILEAIDRQPPAVKDSVRVTGYVDEADKAALLSGATALVFPSLYEGFGFPVLEAQACGTPVVCSNTSSLPEVAGEGALLVDPLDTAALGDAIRRTTADKELRSRLVEEGRKNLSRFGWDIAAEQVLATLENPTPHAALQVGRWATGDSAGADACRPERRRW